MDRPLVACALAGGTGNRLYPSSRSGRPKQFLTLGGDRSLPSRTLERVRFVDDGPLVADRGRTDRAREVVIRRRNEELW